MYARSLHIYGFKCFGKAELTLQYPGRADAPVSEVSNVNLVLGDNGGGKSSVLRALAIAVLAPALLESGFVPYRLVRRVGPGTAPVSRALLKVEAVANEAESMVGPFKKDRLELLARIEQRGGRGNLDRLHLESTPNSPITDLLQDGYSPSFFIVGYGATRRVEVGDYSESSARRSRGPRYQRVAGLFEDHVALRPLQSWLPRTRWSETDRFAEAIDLLNRVLPSNIDLTGDLDKDEEQYIFDFNGLPTPFSSLSDGYKAFVGWVGDLIGHIVEVAPPGVRLDDVPGIVLVDEIDLHLHPEWQRNVLPTLARTFPKIQFVVTSHSPLVLSTVKRENVFVTESGDDGAAIVKQLDEKVYARGVEQLLLSSYFNLTTLKPQGFLDEAQALFQRAAKGDADAALEYLKRLTGTPDQGPALGGGRP